jgi:hypothetical protein
MVPEDVRSLQHPAKEFLKPLMMNSCLKVTVKSVAKMPASLL